MRCKVSSSVLLLFVGGCYAGLPGSAADDDAPAASSDGASSDDADHESGDDDGDDGSDGEPSDCDEGELAAMPGIVRLTHAQYDHSVQDLLGLDVAPSAAFLPDPAVAGFDNNAQALAVGDRLGRDYRRAAEELAGLVVADANALADLLPCAPADGDLACATEFVEDFGRRAYRRPLAADEAARYVALFSSADGLYDTGTPFEQGIRVIVEAMLQSPHFLWRPELSSDTTDGELVRLDDWDIATRLSYLLWQSTPDDELLDAAAAGELGDAAGIEAHARRLLADPRAHATVRDFHEQWLQLDRWEDLQKDADAFPQWDPAIGLAAREETRRFVERVFDEGGGYAELLSSPSSVVNAELAAIYGIDGDFDDSFVPVELDPSARAGLLTQVGFLASHAFGRETSPIHRGVFVHRQILCTVIPDPPANIDTSLPPLEGEIHTTRDAVEAHTSSQACAGCHGLVNEPGFAFEGYDAIGATRTEDHGWPVDTKGSIQLDDTVVLFDDGVELAHAIADSEQARRCYLVNWYRYANMRQETADDACTLDRMHEALEGADYDVKELLVAMTQTTTFRFRRGEP